MSETEPRQRTLAEINREFWTYGDGVEGEYGYQLPGMLAFARARRVSPWGLLGGTLPRVVVQVSPAVQLPALVGANASLNMQIASCGASGAGKGGGEAASRDYTGIGQGVEGMPVGSGEGLVKLFAGADKHGNVTWTQRNVLLAIHEIDSYAAQAGRSGSTIAAELRKGYSGEPLGFAYARAENRVMLPAHSYRLCVTVGVQPGRGSVLLDDIDAGTPQRFLWLPTIDPDAPDDKPGEVLGREWKPPADIAGYQMDHTGPPYVMEVCDQAKSEVDAARLITLRGGGNPLDGHALLTRLKVAAALAILSGHADVNDTDWWLAGLVMEVSDLTRDSIAAHLRRAVAERNERQGHAQARRAEIVAERADEGRIKSCCATILRRLADLPDGEWSARGKLRRACASRDREFFDEAFDRLLSNGYIEVGTTSGRGSPGATARLAR
jgi:hypothetical protein